MKKIKIFCVVLIFILFVISFINQSNQITKLENEIKDLNNKIIEHKEKVEEYKYKLNKIEIKHNEIKEIIEKLDDINLIIEKFEITFYAPHDNQSGMCSDGNQSSTYTGTYPTTGRTIAVDPNVIPLGSKVWIEGFGWRVAEDIGGVVVGNKIDIVIDSYREAIDRGIEKRLVIYKGG